MKNEPDDEPDFLVCAMADQPLAIRGAIFTRLCSQCGSRVMIAPSGQRLLSLHPDLPLLCLNCYVASADLTDAENRLALADDPKIIRHELNQAIPNPWRKRN